MFLTSWRTPCSLTRVIVPRQLSAVSITNPRDFVWRDIICLSHYPLPRITICSRYTTVIMVVSAEVAAKKPKQKQKQYYTRSRTGCLTCRQRHQKCDEVRPIWLVKYAPAHTYACKTWLTLGSSGSCISVQRQCEYPSAVLPLRERRKKCLPGEQQPWTDAVTIPKAIGSCTSVATRPIPMAYRSDELFHYCRPTKTCQKLR